MKTFKRALAVSAAAGVLMAGCQRVVPPTTELAGLRFGSIGLRGATLIADLSITNPNEFALEADSLAFDLEARDPAERTGWTPVTYGVKRERVRVEARANTVIDIPVELAYSRLSAPVRSVIETGSFNYRLRGEVFVREPRHLTVPFGKTGNVSMVGNH